jgi:hypothetical protein
VLTSSLLSPSADLNGIAAGQRRMLAPEASDSVELVQTALLAVGESLPERGPDGVFGEETGQAVSTFKTDRKVLPADPVVGPGTTNRLDLELSYLEGLLDDPARLDARALSLDPFFAGVLEERFGDPGIGQHVIDYFQFGDRLCFRSSFLFGGLFTTGIGRAVEPFIFEDYCQAQRPNGQCSVDDFQDKTPGSAEYVNFLRAHNPTLDPNRIAELGQRKRPDIISHRARREWYEIKPLSISGALAARMKFSSIVIDYAARGLPYIPGTSYTPTPDIVIARFLTPQGEKIDVILETRRRSPGMLSWTLCVSGDYLLYFNRVRLAAGILAILVALAELLLPAEAAAGVLAAIRALAQRLTANPIPLLIPR